MKLLRYNLFESKSEEQRYKECEKQMQHIYEMCVERGIEIFKQEILLADVYDIIMFFHLPPRNEHKDLYFNEAFKDEPEFMYSYRKPMETEWKYYMVINGKTSNVLNTDVDALYWMKKRQDALYVKK